MGPPSTWSGWVLHDGAAVYAERRLYAGKETDRAQKLIPSRKSSIIIRSVSNSKQLNY